MSKNKTNYSKISTEQHIEKLEKEVEETAVETVMPEVVPGIIVNCGKLNIRKRATIKSAVLCILPKGSAIEVYSESLPNEWFKITTASGVEGFCMSNYVQVNQ